MTDAFVLQDPDSTVLLIERRKTSDIVIGVPHHAPLGKETLPCPNHNNSDENAGTLGRYLATLLDCHSVIACNYFLDPNKAEDTDYFRILKEWMPIMHVEIHGHGGKSAEFDIEISSGSENMTVWSEDLSERLAKQIAEVPSLRHYSISGKFTEIVLKATKSRTITSNKWLAIHLELPKSLRASKSQYICFCEALATALLEILARYREDH